MSTYYITHEKRNWSKYNDDIRNVASQLFWEFSEKSQSVDQLWDQIHANMMKISDNVPIIKVMVSRNGAIKSRSAWDKPCLIRTRKQKEKSWANFENFPTALNLSVALHSQRNFEKCHTAAMMKFKTVAASHLKSNPKAFYSYMNSKRKIKAAISGIKDGDGNTLFNAEDIANELGKFFESTFVSETLDGMPTFEIENNSFEDISDIIFTSTDVKFYLERLNVSKSVGPDEIHPKTLKALAGNDTFVMLVAQLFQRSYDLGKIPSVWKNAYVTA